VINDSFMLLFTQRFIDETTAMLQSPQTPESGSTDWGIQVQSTPGVIGAQEVYR
jgi:hypothetical protein